MIWFSELHPIIQALLAGLFTWLITAIGASLVFVSKQFSQSLNDAMLGFAAGVMIAASIWSLLLPAIALSAAKGALNWLPATVGFTGGVLFLRIADQLLPHLHPQLPIGKAEGLKTSWERATLLVLAITLHNIPEGLAVGVAFGAIKATVIEGAFFEGNVPNLSSAIALAVGIGIQNFPEGIAVAMPLRAEGTSRIKSFWYGQLSAIVEPIAAVIGAAAVITFIPLLPYALAFAAGAMMYVVVEELIPASHFNGHEDIATTCTMVGFVVMMVLDVALS